MKPVFLVGIALLSIIIVAPLCTYFVANNTVTDAVNRLEVDCGAPFPIHVGVTDVLYADNFLFTNQASIPLTLEYVNITVYVSSFPSPSIQYAIGSVLATNQTLNANGEIGVSVSFDVTSEDASSLIHGSGYQVGWEVEITASGSYLFWQLTKHATLTRL